MRGTLAIAAPLLLLSCATTGARLANRDDLLANERAFSHRSVEVGAAQAFREYLAPEAVELLAGSPPTRGRDAIVADLQTKPGGPTFVLSWEPDDAAIAASGDLGYTWGHYELTTSAAGKPPKTEKGKYLTVWRKDPATGRWQAIADTGNPF